MYGTASAWPGRFSSTGHGLMTYVDESVYHESILTKGIVLEIDTSPAWQAAGRAVCMAHSAYPQRLCSPLRDVCHVVLTFYNTLKGVFEKHLVFTTDSKTHREHMMPTWSGTFSTPAMYMASQTVLYVSRRTTDRFAHCAHLRKSCSSVWLAVVLLSIR